MRKRQRERRAQYRFVSDHAIDACRLQCERITGGASAPRHDLDFYVVALWRLHEIARMVGDRCHEPEVTAADARFLDALPALRELRNWWVHPPDPGQIGWVSWFEHDVVRLLAGGAVEYLLDVETAQPAAEALYEVLVTVLGEVPTN